MKNVGSLDKIIRVIIGLVLLSVFFVLEGNSKFIGLIGLVPILTAIFGYCPLYPLFGINSCSQKSSVPNKK